MWIASTIGFFKRHNLLKNTMWQLVLVTVGCIVWDLLTGWHGWSVDFVLPGLSIGVLCSMMVISYIQKYPLRECMIYLVMAAVYGFLLPLILVLTGTVTWKLPSLLGAVSCLLFVAGLVLFKGREFKEEMGKNLHI